MKRNPWSDDEVDDDRSDNELDESEPVIPRDTSSRRASGVCVNTSVLQMFLSFKSGFGDMTVHVMQQ